MITEKSNPVEEAQAFLERTLEAEKQLKLAQKLVRELMSCGPDLRKVKQKSEQLSKLTIQLDDLQPNLLGLCQSVQGWVQHEERQRPLRLGRELREAATLHEIPCEPLTSDPPTYRLAPLTVEFQYARGTARLEYARLPLAECPLDAAHIVSLHQRLVADLEGPFDPEEYLRCLFRAYRRRLEVCQLSAGERVDLVDVLPELTLLLQPESFQREPSKENFRAYGKVRFAFDLARLRRSGKLDYKGFRLTLGSATVGSTRDKSRVLFLEEGHKGQYFLSMSFTGTK